MLCATVSVGSFLTAFSGSGGRPQRKRLKMGGVQYGLLQARMSGRPTLIPTRIKPNCHVSDGSLIPASVPPSVALVCPPGWLGGTCTPDPPSTSDGGFALGHPLHPSEAPLKASGWSPRGSRPGLSQSPPRSRLRPFLSGIPPQETPCCCCSRQRRGSPSSRF